MHFDLNIGPLLLQHVQMRLVRTNLPIIDEMERIWGSAGAVVALGEYLSFLRMFADRKPYF